MTTLFAAGLFPDRHSTLFAELCAQFNVIAFRDCGFPRGGEFPYTAGEDLVGDRSELTAGELAWETGRLKSFGETRLSRLLGRHVEIPHDTFRESFDLGFRALGAARRFRRLTEATPIDMAVTSADYSGLTRSVVLEARACGIPTLCVEHAFMGEVPRRDLFRPESRGYNDYASEHVNLDNCIEVDAAYRDHRTIHPDGTPPEFVANGTPHDPVFDPKLGRHEALRRLELPTDRTTVVVIGLWLQPRTPANVFKAQIEAVEAYRQLFEAYAAWPQRDSAQLVIKLHPAFKPAEKFEEAHRCLTRLAREAGCPAPRITVVGLPEALAAADVLVSFGFSAVFWDGFLMGRPSIVFPTPIYVARLASQEALRTGNVLLEHGLIRVAYSGDELWSWVAHYMDPDHLREFEGQVDKVKREHRISMRSSREKSEDLCAWIHERLG